MSSDGRHIWLVALEDLHLALYAKHLLEVVVVEPQAVFTPRVSSSNPDYKSAPLARLVNNEWSVNVTGNYRPAVSFFSLVHSIDPDDTALLPNSELVQNTATSADSLLLLVDSIVFHHEGLLQNLRSNLQEFVTLSESSDRIEKVAVRLASRSSGLACDRSSGVGGHLAQTVSKIKNYATNNNETDRWVTERLIDAVWDTLVMRWLWKTARVNWIRVVADDGSYPFCLDQTKEVARSLGVGFFSSLRGEDGAQSDPDIFLRKLGELLKSWSLQCQKQLSYFALRHSSDSNPNQRIAIVVVNAHLLPSYPARGEPYEQLYSDEMVNPRLSQLEREKGVRKRYEADADWLGIVERFFNVTRAMFANFYDHGLVVQVFFCGYCGPTGGCEA